MKEYQRFSPDSVNGSDSTAGLKRNIDKDDNKIIVTTIQKMNNLMKSEKDLAVYQKQVVFIFDEAITIGKGAKVIDFQRLSIGIETAS